VTIAEKDALAQEAEEIQQRKELAAEQRKKESHDLVAESIRRELAESMSLVFIVLTQQSNNACRGKRGIGPRCG
jgi:hypothetical protein